MSQQCLGQRVCAHTADPGHFRPALGTGVEHPFDAAEALEQRSRGDVRDAGNSGKDGQARRGRDSCVLWAISRPRLPSLAKDEPVDPEGRVGRVPAAQDPDAELADGQQSAASRVWMSRSSVEVVAFDEEQRRHGHVTDAPDLSP